MMEYKILRTTVSSAEEEINRLADQGWRVVATSLATGCSFTVASMPMIVTLERKASSM